MNNLADFLSNGENHIFDYVKFVLYGTDDKTILEEKEKALKLLFEGVQNSLEQKFDIASRQIKEAIDIFKETKDDLSLAFAYFFMAQIYHVKEDKEYALPYYEKSYKIFKAKGNMMALHIEQKLQELNIKGR